jgi:hypothetical protein
MQRARSDQQRRHPGDAPKDDLRASSCLRKRLCHWAFLLHGGVESGFGTEK